MTWTVKDDAEEAISLGRVMGEDPNGGTRLEYTTFMPGQEIPTSYIAPVIDRIKNDDGDHLWRFIETDDPDVDMPSAPPPPAPTESSPHTPVPQRNWDNEDLAVIQAEIAARGLTPPTSGSGSNGSVIKADLVAFLKQDDELKNNPFGPTPS
jgi:hypothetical protein